MNDEDCKKVRDIHRFAEAKLQQGNARIVDRQQARQDLFLTNLIYGLDETVHDLREQLAEDEMITRDRLARAWQDGFKQGGPMHDVNFDDPDAHTRNPYRGGTR